MSDNQTPIACDLSVLDTAQRQQHEQTTRRVFAAARAVDELANGYAFRFAPETELIVDLARFISLERLCCPFFDFGLEVAREQGAVTLSLTGGQGVKAYLAAEMAGRESSS